MADSKKIVFFLEIIRVALIETLIVLLNNLCDLNGSFMFV